MIKKEWLIWGAILMLAAGLIVALVLVTQPPKDAPYSPETTVETQPDSVPTEPSSQETTLPGLEETKPSEPENTQPSAPTEPSTPDGTEPTQPEKETDGPGGFEDRPTQKPDDPTKPTDPTEPEETDPTEPEETDPTEPDETDPPAGEKMTYRAYLELSTEEQIAFQNTFPSRNAFKDWYQQAKKEYEDSQHQVTIGPDGGLDIGDYINP